METMNIEYTQSFKKGGKKGSATPPLHLENNTSKEPVNLAVLLKQFIQINTNISDMKAQIKDLTGRSKQLESQIVTIMNARNLQNIDTQTNVIQIKTTTTKQAINQKTLMTYFVSNLHIPQDTIKTFVDQLPTKTVQTLSIKSKPS